MASSPSSGQPDSELTLDQIHTSALEMREKINAIRVDYFRAAIQTEAGLLHAKNEYEPPIEQRSFSLAYPIDLGDGITLPKKVITSYFGALRQSPKPGNCIESVDVLEVSLIKVNDDVTEEDFEVVTAEL